DAGAFDANGVGDAGAIADADAGGPAPPLTLVVLPDTQYYAAAFPDVFDSQLRWVAGQIENQNIALVLHEGDIVDSDVPEQWQIASRARASGSRRTPRRGGRG